jgi:integrase
MGDALMNWDAKQSRWRRDYRGKTYRIKASDLGGSNATDTKLPANKWFQEQKAERDRELALATPRPNELNYLATLESIRTEMKALVSILRGNPSLESVIFPVITVQKHKEMLLMQALRQEVLPPLDDTLSNPLHFSPERIEAEVVREIEQMITARLRGQAHSPFDYLYLRSLPHDDQSTVSFTGTAYNDPTFTTTDGNGDPVYNERVQEVAKTIASQTISAIAQKKKELGLIDNEYDRGRINQMLQEHGATIPENLKLEYHIEKFLEARKKDCALEKIAPCRLKKIVNSLDIYRRWSPIINGNVERIGTKEHIEAYHSFIAKRLSVGEIKPRYANDLFNEFKALINWFVTEEVLKEYPRCLHLKNTRYRFSVMREKPKVIPLDLVHRILEATTDNPRLKLFILLTLNCGFGASEIGQLHKDEYDPATGRIAHRRYKTEKFDSVPVVVYKLWAETKVLLDQEIDNRKNYPKHSQYAKLLLVNENGTPLLRDSIDKARSDNITCSFKRLIARLRKADPEFPSTTYYSFRRTVSTLIFNEPEYMGLAWLWLGHAPNTTAKEHYIAPSKTVLDGCIDWLHGEIFGSKSPSEAQETLK